MPPLLSYCDPVALSLVARDLSKHTVDIIALLASFSHVSKCFIHMKGTPCVAV